LTVELDELLRNLDRTAANLARLESIWEQAKEHIPSGPSAGSTTEYDNLARAWRDVRKGLPPLNGWTIEGDLPDIDAMGRAFIDYFEIGEPPFPLYEEGEKPGRDLAEYRYRLDQARRKAVRGRLEQLVATVDSTLARLLEGVPRHSTDRVDTPEAGEVASNVAEIERLMGDLVERTGRWSDLHRHLRFGQGQDWHDIAEHDWPSVRPDVEAAGFSDTDPLPVPNIDLGEAADGDVTGTATTALPWDQLDAETFERLLFDLLRAFPENRNVEWLMPTNAPDRGRDLSMYRDLRVEAGSIRSERVIVQDKHWRSHSVNARDISDTLTNIKLWEPPLVRVLIVATSGRFTQDGVQWAEKHNETGQAPYIDLWNDATLEALLSQKPALAAAYHLR
jgi:hypothetical protein